MKPLPTLAALLTTALLLAGCGSLQPLADDAPGVMRAGSLSASTAVMKIVPGQTTRADLGALMGRPNVVRFDSGWEVWVWRWPGADRTPRTATELVALLEPGGVVKKVRVRPGYPPAAR